MHPVGGIEMQVPMRPRHLMGVVHLWAGLVQDTRMRVRCAANAGSETDTAC